MGQSLLEFRTDESVVWEDTDSVEFKDSSVEWNEATLQKMALEDYSDRSYWADDIIQYTPPQYHIASITGGFVRMDFGDIELRLDAFGGRKEAGVAIFTDTADVAWTDTTDEVEWNVDEVAYGDPSTWPPPREIFVTQKYTDSDESGLVIMFDGVGHRAGFDSQSVKYDLYGKRYTQQFLSTVTDYNTDTVPIPRALGAVTYAKVLRLPDDGSSRPTYHNGYIAGTNGVNWSVFDDGVNIDANVVDNADDTFSLTATPVGEVTISGTGTIETLSELYTWASAAARLSLSYTYSASLESSPSPSISYWWDSQGILIDVLSQISAYFRHLFYESGANLVAVEMSNTNGTRSLIDGYDWFKSSYYEDPAPTSIIRASWVQRNAVEETIGKYVKDTTVEETQESTYPYGAEKSVTPYQYTRSDVSTSLTSLLAYEQKSQVHLSIPIVDDLPVPGEQITFTDTDNFEQDLAVTMFCRNVRYDFENDSVEISGDGVLT
jgi:hypothetical protein